MAIALQVGPEHGLHFTQQEMLEVEAVAEFWKKVGEDKHLQEKLETVVGITNREEKSKRINEVARAAGFSFSAAAWDEISQPAFEILEMPQFDVQLREDELNAIVGGVASATIPGTDLPDPSRGTVMCPW